MRAERNSLITQLVGKKITIIDRNITGTIMDIKIDKQCKQLIINLAVKTFKPHSYVAETQLKEVRLSFVLFFKTCTLHSLIR